MRLSAPLVVSSYTLVFFLGSLWFLAFQVNPRAPFAYMDEIFHVPQTQAYCRGRWRDWDDKITTFPGLYLTAVAYAKAIALVRSAAGEAHEAMAPVLVQAPAASSGSSPLTVHTSDACPTALLRTINVVYGALCIPVVFLLLRKLHPAAYARRPMALVLSTIQLSLFPLAFFFHFLYYTDTASLFWVLLAYLAHLSSHAFLGATIGLVAVLHRQTNIVWVGFMLLTTIIRQWTQNDPEVFDEKRDTGAGTGEDGEKGEKLAARELYHPTRWSGFPRTLVRFVLSCVRALPNLVLHHFGLLLLCLAFVLFVLLNGNSIVVGDKAHHVVSVHLPQVMYFALFAAGMTATNWLGPVMVQATLRGIWRNKLLSSVILMGMLASVHWFTLAHPFLVADNRHYTFYVWKNFFARWSWFRYAMAPVYLLAGGVLQQCWSSVESKSLLFQATFWLVVGLCLIPTPLIEPRYFTTPFVVWFMHAAPTLGDDTKRSMLAIALYLVVNAATLYVFLARPFTWPDGSEARFMW